MKAKAVAPANIAFIKYWGKYNEKLRLPANSSISMNLSNCITETSVEFDEKLKCDKFTLDGHGVKEDESKRVFKHLDMIRQIAGIKIFAKVDSKNNFPKASGIASSASGFAALTVAGVAAAGIKLSQKDLSILARIGSGSACRSIPDGIVEWRFGKTDKTSYAVSLYPTNYWDLTDLIAVVGSGEKKVGSSEGHKLADSSPFYNARILGMPKKVREIKTAFKNKDFTKLGEIIEAEAINMHTVMMTSTPPLFYWLPETLAVTDLVLKMRERGIESYFTIDAGPNVHIICERKNTEKIKKELIKTKNIKKIIENKVGEGTHLI